PDGVGGRLARDPRRRGARPRPGPRHQPSLVRLDPRGRHRRRGPGPRALAGGRGRAARGGRSGDEDGAHVTDPGPPGRMTGRRVRLVFLALVALTGAGLAVGLSVVSRPVAPAPIRAT